MLTDFIICLPLCFECPQTSSPRKFLFTSEVMAVEVVVVVVVVVVVLRVMVVVCGDEEHVMPLLV